MQSFFAALWPQRDVPGNLTFWMAPSRDSAHVPLRALDQLDQESLDELHAINHDKRQNLYYGLSTRRDGLERQRQGGKKDLIAMPGFCLDIDFHHPAAHTAQNLPRTEQEAFEIIRHAPDPSIIVHTGYGWHCYWLFDAPVVFRSSVDQEYLARQYKAFQSQFIERAAELGWHVDWTATCQRVWRVPGFKNWKVPDDPQIVTMQHCDATVRYAPASLVDGLSAPACLQGPAPAAVLSESTYVPQNVTSQLYSLLEAMQHLSPGSANKSLIDAALAGQSFAERGNRDAALQKVCSTIAWLPPARDMDPHCVVEVLRPSLTVWANEPGAVKSVEEEIDKAVDKIERAQQDWRDHDARQRAGLEGLARMVKKRAGFSKVDDLKKYALIVYRNAYYVYNGGKQTTDPQPEGYGRSVLATEVLTCARHAWENLPELELTYLDDKQVVKAKTLTRVLAEYCEMAEDLVGSLTIDHSYFDVDDRTFYVAMARRRVHEAVFHADVDEWLRLLGGNQADKLLDWIAAVTQLDQQCCALYLSGVGGTGKTLLATGLAQLWSTVGPTPLTIALSAFNARISSCPLLLLDEGSFEGKKLSEHIRELVGSSSFIVNEKYQPNTTVQGSIRLMITANNLNVLTRADEEFSAADLQALVGRLLHIETGSAAQAWMQTHNVDRLRTHRWVQEDCIAQHALWLREHRVITQGKRFIVEGDENSMHRRMLLKGKTNELVLEWLVRFCTNPQSLDVLYKAQKRMPRAHVANNEILVNTQAIHDSWHLYMQHEQYDRPRSGRVSRVLAQLSDGIKKIGSRVDQRIVHHKVRSDLVLEWAEETQVGDVDEIRKHLTRTR